jgi:hypothetical protein
VVAIELLRETIESLKLKPKIVLGDANYDVEKILDFIVNDMHALPIIPRNPRRTIGENYFIQENKIYCLAGLVMYRKGKMRNKKSAVLYCQYSCPLNYGKERKNYLVCPVFHEKFFKGKGCNVLIRLEPSVRQNIPYDTEFFKTEYRKRTAVERIFSRLLSIAMQEPTVVGLNAISNHATIAHIAVLLVALTAYKNGYKDKIRFVKSFVPKFL